MGKIPLIVSSSIICLVLGAAAAVAAMAFFGPDLAGVRLTFAIDRAANRSAGAGAEGAPMMEKGKGKGKGGGGGMMGMKMGKGGPGGMMGKDGPGGMMAMMMMGKGASPTKQLESLVAKLDRLTGTPLKLDLTKEQRKEVSEHLRGVLKAENMNDDDAKTHLDALLKILESQKDVLAAAGFNWPGLSSADGAGMQEHLASLQKRLKEESK